MEDYRTNRDFDILFFYNGNNDYICNVLLDEAEFQMPVILDVDSIFHKSYEIFENPTYRTMLLGKDNKPLLIGNIVGNKKMENLYRKELSK